MVILDILAASAGRATICMPGKTFVDTNILVYAVDQDEALRRDASRKAIEAHAHETPEVDPGFDVDLERTVCECVNDLIPLLKLEYSNLIRRVDLEGANVSSVADEIGISAGNARVRLHRARAALRDELEKSCRTCATHGCLDCTCSRSEPAPT